jgi:hypothetical protein
MFFRAILVARNGINKFKRAVGALEFARRMILEKEHVASGNGKTSRTSRTSD